MNGCEQIGQSSAERSRGFLRKNEKGREEMRRDWKLSSGKSREKRDANSKRPNDQMIQKLFPMFPLDDLDLFGSSFTNQ